MIIAFTDETTSIAQNSQIVEAKKTNLIHSIKQENLLTMHYN